MPASTFSLTFTDLLYVLCSALLLGSAVLVFLRSPRSRVHRCYALTALSLLGWVATLALFYRSEDPAAALALGRANFAAAALAVAFGYLLVEAVADRRTTSAGVATRQVASLSPVEAFILAESLLLALVSGLTPLIDRAELLGSGVDGRHVTVYGPLFPLYCLHVLGYLVASARAAFRARAQEVRGAVRDQLTLVGAGVLATGAVGVVAGIVLPYGLGDFRFTDWGPLSSALFLLAVGYAVAKHHLFDLRRFVKRTLVLGVLGTVALAAYGAVVVLATEAFAGAGADGLTRFSVLVIALSFDPLRRALEKRVDALLFPQRGRIRRAVRQP